MVTFVAKLKTNCYSQNVLILPLLLLLESKEVLLEHTMTEVTVPKSVR